jgi:hypothetical protein
MKVTADKLQIHECEWGEKININTKNYQSNPLINKSTFMTLSAISASDNILLRRK